MILGEVVKRLGLKPISPEGLLAIDDEGNVIRFRVFPGETSYLRALCYPIIVDCGYEIVLPLAVNITPGFDYFININGDISRIRNV